MQGFTLFSIFVNNLNTDSSFDGGGSCKAFTIAFIGKRIGFPEA